MRITVATLGLLLTVSPVFAQAERYELGERLKAFEAGWDKQPDVAARKRALVGLSKVTNQFFTFQFGEAGRTLDDARFALESDKPPADDLRWATALYPDVPKRLIDGSADLTVNLKAFYTVKGKRPDKLTVRFTLGTGKPVTMTPEKLPAEVKVPLPPAEDGRRRDDLALKMEVLIDGRPVVTRSVGVSVIDGAEVYAERLIADAEAIKPPTLESASIAEREVA